MCQSLWYTDFHLWSNKGFPGGTSSKEPTCQCNRQRDAVSIPGSGRSPGIPWNGNPLQYSCLGHPMDRGARQATVYRVTKGGTQLKRLSTHAHAQIILSTLPGRTMARLDQNFPRILRDEPARAWPRSSVGSGQSGT